MKYIVDVVEQLCTTVEVEADSLEEAREKVRDAYYNEDIVLGAENFMDVDFFAEEA